MSVFRQAPHTSLAVRLWHEEGMSSALMSGVTGQEPVAALRLREDAAESTASWRMTAADKTAATVSLREEERKRDIFLLPNEDDRALRQSSMRRAASRWCHHLSPRVIGGAIVLSQNRISQEPTV